MPAWRLPQQATIRYSRSRGDLRKLEALKEESLRRKSAGTVVPVGTDLSDAASVSHAVADISRQARGVEVLVNNAGKLTHKPFEALSMKEWKEVYEVNVFGTVELTRQLLPLAESGRITGTYRKYQQYGRGAGSAKVPGAVGLYLGQSRPDSPQRMPCGGAEGISHCSELPGAGFCGHRYVFRRISGA
jgi:NAD(P)-dependent dehydrogenase (short-subunit alcohol dehydrogenase family)